MTLARVLTEEERTAVALHGRYGDPVKIAAHWRYIGGFGTPDAARVAVLLASARGKVEKALSGREVSKSVTVPRVTPQSPTEEVTLTDVKSEAPAQAPPAEDFVARAERALAEVEALRSDAQAEAERVLKDLARLQFRADQVVRVFKALKLDVPHALADFGGAGFRQITSSLYTREQPEKPVEQPEAPAAPEPKPDPTPEPPAAEKLPEQPSVNRGAESARAKAAENKERVAHLIIEAGQAGIRLGQLVEAAGVNQNTVSRIIRELIDSKEIERVGTKGSKTAFYRALAPAEDPRVPPKVEAAGSIEPEWLARIRDVAVKQPQGTLFDVGTIAELVKLPRPIVLTGLKVLAERDVLKDASPTEDMPLFMYVKPTDPGAAAKIDQARRAEPESNGVRSAPVPGTGQQLRSSHGETQQLLRKIHSAGGEVRRRGDSHLKVVNPRNGRETTISSTPSTGDLSRTYAKVRALGLAVGSP